MNVLLSNLHPAYTDVLNAALKGKHKFHGIGKGSEFGHDELLNPYHKVSLGTKYTALSLEGIPAHMLLRYSLATTRSKAAKHVPTPYDVNLLLCSQIAFMNELLDQREIELVITGYPPIACYENALAIACKQRNIPVIVTCETHWRGSFSARPLYEKNNAQAKLTYNKDLISQHLIESLPAHYDDIERRSYWYSNERTFHKPSAVLIDNSNIADHTWFGTKDFGVFCLHYQPEDSTEYYGIDYNDQLEAFKEFVIICKNNDLIPTVKDHYVTSQPATRTSLFYKKLNDILNRSGGKFIDISQAEFSRIIKKASFISSVTGTVCLEAAVLGIPSYIFGDPWYRCVSDSITHVDSVNSSEFILPKNTQRLTKDEYVNNMIDSEYCKSLFLGHQRSLIVGWNVAQLSPKEVKQTIKSIYSLISQLS